MYAMAATAAVLNWATNIHVESSTCRCEHLASCHPLQVRLGMVHQSHVGMYALLGAASFLGGLMRMSASMCLILMEMTASPRQLPFLMMVSNPACRGGTACSCAM